MEGLALQSLSKELFKTEAGVITKRDFIDALQALEASSFDTLFIHSDLAFGAPLLRRGELLGEVLDVLKSLGARNLIFPTFSFSFCNHEAFSVKDTRGVCGALSEFARKTAIEVALGENGKMTRSLDPLLSCVLLGRDKEILEVGHESIGAHSIFANLPKHTAFLFLGLSVSSCWTYSHFIEWEIKVPYRYEREFSGTMIAGGREYTDIFTQFTRFSGVEVYEDNRVDDLMSEKGILKEADLGTSSLRLIPLLQASEALKNRIATEPYFMLKATPASMSKDYIFEKKIAL